MSVKKSKIVVAVLATVFVALAIQISVTADNDYEDNTLKIIDQDEDPDSDSQSIYVVDEDTELEIQEIKEALAIKRKQEEALSLVNYIKQLTNLNESAAKKILSQSEALGLDPFVILAIMRVESVFDPYAVGALGERGLGQLMDNTARPVAQNLGIPYDPDRLFEPEYNILLFTTQLKYLYDFYEGNIHKTLTAYNRGQYGLERFIASRSTIRNPEQSSYSIMILDFAAKYQYEFDNQ